MDYALYQSLSYNRISELGQRVTLKRADVDVAKTYALVTQKDTSDDGSVTMTNLIQTVLLIPGNIKTPPAPGDEFYMAKSKILYKVEKVQEINPAGIPLLYKVTVV